MAASETRKVLGDYRLLGYRIGKHTPDTVDTVRERVALPDNTQTLAVQRLWVPQRTRCTGTRNLANYIAATFFKATESDYPRETSRESNRQRLTGETTERD